MDSILPYLFAAIPYLAVVLIALLAVAGMGLGLACPRALAYPYLAVFFWMNSTSYGSLSVFATGGIYSRGSGLLLFALVLWYVLGAWCCARISSAFQERAAPACSLQPWLLGWLVLLLGHVAVALASGIKLSAALAPSGFSNLVWMAPAIALLLLAFRTRAQARELLLALVVAGLLRALFGLVRWAAFGGDPNNVYANRNAIPIRLTFFDINDSLLCAAAFTAAAVQLLHPAMQTRSRSWTFLLWCTLAATGATIILSYRRTAWIGFLLAIGLLAWQFPWRTRLRMAAVGLPPLLAGIGLVLARRFPQAGQGSMFYDMQSQRFGARSERLLELQYALADVAAHPFTGIGAWGRYAGFEHISWQATPDGGLFVHSGVLHLALKAGLPGLVLLCGLAWAFVRACARALRQDDPVLLALATAGAAGAAFMLPDLLVGTPIPQVRTTQMLAICMALPYIALHAASAGSAAPALRVKPARTLRALRPAGASQA